MSDQFIVTRRDEDGTWYLMGDSGMVHWSSTSGDAQRFERAAADALAARINAAPPNPDHITGPAKVVPVKEGT